MELNKTNNNYIQEIKYILAQARQKAYAAVNTAMVEAYWLDKFKEAVKYEL